MPWCPKCKLEYVEGIKVCPDCKSALVAVLTEDNEEQLDEDKYFDDIDDEENDEDENEDAAGELAADPVMLELLKTLKQKGIPDDQIQDVITILKARTKHANAVYKPVSEKYNDNKSGASVLLICGLAGIVCLILNALGILHLPISGYSLYLTYFVMGTLFLIFFVSGITSMINIKKLAPKVSEEEAKIQELIDYLKEENAKGSFEMNIPDIPEEEMSLLISQKAVQACEDRFPDVAPGFSFYVVDRHYEEIFGAFSSDETSEEE